MQAYDAEADEPIAFAAIEEEVDSSTIVHDDDENYSYETMSSTDDNDEHLIYYDWVADTAATSHITHRCDAFTTYERIPEVPISGVGGIRTHAIA
jgi:hypothetical protein